MTTQLETMLSELEAKAKASTCGPWKNEQGVVSARGLYVVRHGRSDHSTMQVMEAWSKNADYIAAANPSTIERLISIIRRLEEAVKAEHYCGDPGVDCDACNALADVERIAGEK